MSYLVPFSAFVVSINESRTKPMAVNFGLRAEETGDQRLFAHLEREEPNGLAVLDSGMSSDVEPQGGFSQRGPRGNHHQFAGLKTSSLFIKVRYSSRDTRNLAAPV